MPNPLPVPSKAALRTLRRIALGTSCTVAFTTGLLTEDRRRRIHCAREVHNNAKKLKASRKYHSGGSPSDSFINQVMRNSDDGFWLAKDSLEIQSAQAALPRESTLHNFTHPHPEPPPFKISKYQLLPPSNIAKPQRLDPIQIPATKVPVRVLPPEPSISQNPKLRELVDNPGESARVSSLYRQRKLAVDVITMLESEEAPSHIDAAALRFFEAFEEGLLTEDSGIVRELTDAAAQLSKACQLDGKFDASEKIFGVLSGYGPIDEDVFFSLGMEGVVRNLISGVDGSAGDAEMNASKLRKAVALYITKFKEKPRISSTSWVNLGETLCATTHRYELFGLTEEVYWRLDKSSDDISNRCVYYLMAALHKQGYHKKVVQMMRRLLAHTCLDQLNGFNTGTIVIDSALKLQRLDIAEEVLINLAKMSAENETKCSTSWFLKVLGADWRNYRDITRTRALFERLEPHFHLVAHPRAAYGAIIQFCIEASDEDAARWYYDYRLEKAPPGSATKYDIRIHGHFTFAKAMHGDWTGVKEDFWKMRQLSPDKFALSASFIPIFKLFADSHPVNETEDFIRFFIDQDYVVLTPYMSTTMVNKYAATREIDSISRWLDYMISVRSPADAMLFNAIMHNCRTKWNFSFEEVYGLYKKVRQIGAPAAKYVNEHTILILRGAAMAGAGNNLAGAVRNLNRLKLDHPLKLKLSVDSKKVREHMVNALARGDPRRALRIYERARKRNVPMDPACISTVVQAALQVDPNDIYTAASLLREPQKNGLNISAAVAIIFVHQLSYKCSNLPGGPTQVQDVARNTIGVLQDGGVEVHPSILTHTMHTLVSQQQCYQAIDFWKSMAASQKTSIPLDLPTLTVLLQAFIGARDCASVEWAIQMLSANNLIPDQSFKRPLKSTFTKMSKDFEFNNHGYYDHRFYNVVKNALRSISEMRFEATKDKENVKTMTLKIMEKAIEIDKMLDLKSKAQRTNERPWGAQLADEEKSLRLPSESPIEGDSLEVALES